MASGELINKALRFAAAVVLARSLTASDFGKLNVAIALAGIMVIVASAGLPDLGARHAALPGADRRLLAGRVFLIRLVNAAGVVALVSLVVLVFAADELSLVALAGVMTLVMASSTDWLVRGAEYMGTFAIATAMGGVTLLLSSLLVASGHLGLTAALLAFIAAEVAYSAILMARTVRIARPRPTLSGGRSLLKEARPLAVASVLVYSYYANVDTILLATIGSAREAGIYSAPYRLFLLLNLLGVFAAMALLPILTRMNAAGDAARARFLLKRAVHVLALAGALCAVIVLAAGSDLLRFAFGPTFVEGFPTFLLLVSAVPWYSMGLPTGYSLIAAGRNREFMLGAGYAGAVSIGLNLLLIPFLGMEGAGLATLVSFMLAAVIWIRSSELSFHDVRAALLLAGLVVGLCVLAVAFGTATPWIALAVGAVSAGYLVVLLLRRSAPES